MISVGDNILSNPVGDALERQKDYAKALGYIDMIVFSPKTNNLEANHYENLSIYPTKSINILTFVFDVLNIAKKILKKKKIDVITTQDPFGTALAGYFLKKIYNIPLHIQNHSSFLDNVLWISEKPILFNFFNNLAHFTIMKSDRLRVVNTREKEKYIRKLNINKNKIDIAPLPIKLDFWGQVPDSIEIKYFIEKYNIDLSKPILSWAGRPVKVKNFQYLFNSVGLVNKEIKVSFLIAGNMKDSYWNLKELEMNSSITPIYTGLLSHKELRVLYHITSVFLLTSNYEGFNGVVADAQASGTVVVSKRIAGTEDIIDDGNSGFLIDGNEDIFSKKVIQVLSNNKKRKFMERYSSLMINKKFNYNNMFESVVMSIRKTLEEDKV